MNDRIRAVRRWSHAIPAITVVLFILLGVIEHLSR